MACRYVCSSGLLLLAVLKAAQCNNHQRAVCCCIIGNFAGQALRSLLLHRAADDRPLGALTVSASRAAVPASQSTFRQPRDTKALCCLSMYSSNRPDSNGNLILESLEAACLAALHSPDISSFWQNILLPDCCLHCKSASARVAQLHRAAAEPAVAPVVACLTSNAVYAADLHH